MTMPEIMQPHVRKPRFGDDFDRSSGYRAWVDLTSISPRKYGIIFTDFATQLGIKLAPGQSCIDELEVLVIEAGQQSADREPSSDLQSCIFHRSAFYAVSVTDNAVISRSILGHRGARLSLQHDVHLLFGSESAPGYTFDVTNELLCLCDSGPSLPELI